VIFFLFYSGGAIRRLSQDRGSALAILMRLSFPKMGRRESHGRRASGGLSGRGMRKLDPKGPQGCCLEEGEDLKIGRRRSNAMEGGGEDLPKKRSVMTVIFNLLLRA